MDLYTERLQLYFVNQQNLMSNIPNIIPCLEIVFSAAP